MFNEMYIFSASVVNKTNTKDNVKTCFYSVPKTVTYLKALEILIGKYSPDVP